MKATESLAIPTRLITFNANFPPHFNRSRDKNVRKHNVGVRDGRGGNANLNKKALSIDSGSGSGSSGSPSASLDTLTMKAIANIVEEKVGQSLEFREHKLMEQLPSPSVSDIDSRARSQEHGPKGLRAGITHAHDKYDQQTHAQ